MTRRPVARALGTVVVALTVLVLLPVAALAHASFDVRQVPAASSQELVLRVPLESDGRNDVIEVLVPGAFTVDACDDAQGWSCQQDTTTDGDTVLLFERAPDGPGDTEHFALTVTAPQEQGVYPFPTIQTYDDGQEAAWIGGPGSDHPAPRVQVGDETTPMEPAGGATPHPELGDGEPTAAPTAPPGAGSSPSEGLTGAPTAAASAPPGDDTGDAAGGASISGALLAIAVALVVIGGGVAAVLLRRRRG